MVLVAVVEGAGEVGDALMLAGDCILDSLLAGVPRTEANGLGGGVSVPTLDAFRR